MDKRVESMQIGVDEVCRLRDTIRTLEEQLAAKDERIAELTADLVQYKTDWKDQMAEENAELRKEVERLKATRHQLEMNGKDYEMVEVGEYEDLRSRLEIAEKRAKKMELWFDTEVDAHRATQKEKIQAEKEKVEIFDEAQKYKRRIRELEEWQASRKETLVKLTERIRELEENDRGHVDMHNLAIENAQRGERIKELEEQVAALETPKGAVPYNDGAR